MISQTPPTVLTTGFTLIDLMITIVIASVLTAIAIPVYRNHMQQSRITEATSQLSILQLQLEQYFQDNRLYGMGADGTNCAILLPTQNNFIYTCTIEKKGQSYLLMASGIDGRGMQEFKFDVNEAGLKRTVSMPIGWGDKPVNCWVIKSGALCQ